MTLIIETPINNPYGVRMGAVFLCGRSVVEDREIDNGYRSRYTTRIYERLHDTDDAAIADADARALSCREWATEQA